MNLPPPILSSTPGSFPWRVLAKRHPVLLGQVRAGHPYGSVQQRRLDQLLDSITRGHIPPVPADDPGGDQWQAWNQLWAGQNWFDVPFLVAENFFYRHLLEATGYFAPGPWQGADPFAQLKAAELTTVDAAQSAQSAQAAESADGPDGQAVLLASVWGNQADLGFRATAGPDRAKAGLVADDSARLWDRLAAASSGRVVMVTDNAGRELIADLLLADHLLATGLAGAVALHVKPAPYFVSDAMTADVVACLGALAASGPPGAAAAARLRAAAAQDALTIATHWFYCSPLTYHDLPAELAGEFAAASAVLLKGDLNYRRLVGDCHWDPAAGFAAAVNYFPGWVAALRTLKSDVILGLSPGILERLEATGDPWRTSGAWALIQTSS